jgi:DNA polymerase-1
MAVKIYVDAKDTTPFGRQQIDAAQARLDAFWRTNPTLAVIRDSIGASAISDGVSTTLGGRRRHYETRGLPHWQLKGIERQAVSSVIQGTAADVAKLAQNLIYGLVADIDPEAWLWSATHDEIALECEETMAPDWNDLLPALMTEAFETYLTHVPCELDGGVQTKWSH